MGKPGKKQRTNFQIEQDYKQMAKMYLYGKTQSEIARELNLSQPFVSKELQVIKKRWQESAVCKFDERQAIELARIDERERDFLDAWEKSKQPMKRIEQIPIYKRPDGKLFIDTDGNLQEKVEGIKAEPKRHGEVVTKEIVQERLPDSRYLEGALRCVDMRLKIFGIYRSNIKDGQGEYLQLPEGNVRTRMAILLSVFESIRE